MSNTVFWHRTFFGDESMDFGGIYDVVLSRWECDIDDGVDISGLRLILNIVMQAAIDDDEEYFHSEVFEKHCTFLRIGANSLREIIQSAKDVRKQQKLLRNKK